MTTKKPWLSWLDRNDREQCEWVLARFGKYPNWGSLLHNPEKDHPYDSIMRVVNFWPVRGSGWIEEDAREKKCRQLADAWRAHKRRQLNASKRAYSFVMSRGMQSRIVKLSRLWGLDRNATVEKAIGLCDRYEKQAKENAERAVQQEMGELERKNKVLRERLEKLSAQKGFPVLNRIRHEDDSLVIEFQHMQSSIQELAGKVDKIAWFLAGLKDPGAPRADMGADDESRETHYEGVASEPVTDQLLANETQADIEKSDVDASSTTLIEAVGGSAGLPVVFMEQLKEVSPAGINEKLLRSSINTIRKKDFKNHAVSKDEPLTAEQLARIFTSYSMKMKNLENG